MGGDTSQVGVAAEAMFAQMMIPHHEQAVVMAEFAETRAEDAQLEALAAEIKATQQPEIDLMESWLTEWGVARMAGDEAMMMHGGHGMSGMLTDEQLAELENSEGAAFDLLFAEFMIMHHVGAIDMARDVLVAGSDERVLALAREIIVTQETEILRLQAFLNGEDAGTVDITAISPRLGHLHGAVVSGSDLLIGTHDGVHRVAMDSGRSERVGESADDFMGFAGDPQGLLAASGHPGPGSSLPNPLGLITSTDEGRTWQPVSLTGEVDFHSLAVNTDQIVGWDTRGPLLWSVDAGSTWEQGPLVTPTSLAWFDGVVWLATSDSGLAMWVPGDRAIRPIQGQIPAVLLAASEDGSALWRIDRDGSVHRTLDGEKWSPAGRVLSVEAFAAERDRAFAVTMTSLQVLTVRDR
jgi:uncharacterized protein (DUF305 family)